MKRDTIDEILQSKLDQIESCEVAPSWEEFQFKQKQKKSVSKFWRNTASSIAVAATIALAIYLSTPNLMPIDQLPQKQIQIIQTTDNTIVIIGSEDSKYELKVHHPSIVSAETSTGAISEDPIDNSPGLCVDPKPTPQYPKDKPVDPQNSVADEAPKVQKQPYTGKRNYKVHTVNFDSEKPPRKLAMAAYSQIQGQNSHATSTINKLYNSPASDFVVMTMMNDKPQIVNFDNLSELTHKFPVTFGLTLALPLTQKLSLESGVNYTYLESTSETTKDLRYQYTQKVKYIGVPVALSYKIVNTRLFDIYASGGVMAEVAISPKGTTHILNGQSVISTSEKNINAPGLQFSANAAAGVNIHLTRGIGIYLEPGVSHYFENSNQPLTYRNQNDLQFNLRTGLKFQF